MQALCSALCCCGAVSTTGMAVLLSLRHRTLLTGLQKRRTVPLPVLLLPLLLPPVLPNPLPADPLQPISAHLAD